MVNQKLIAISYFCFFMFVYLSSIAYSILPQVIQNEQTKALPQTAYTQEVTQTMSALGMTSSITPLVIITVIIIAALIYGCMNTFSAY